MEDKKNAIDAEVVNEESKKEEEKEENNSFDNETIDQLIKAVDSFPIWLKLILCIPAVDIVWWFYRIIKSAAKNNTGGIVVAVILMVIGIPFMWIIDLLCVAINGKVWWID